MSFLCSVCSLYWVHQATKVVVLLLLYKLIMSVWGMMS